MHVTADPWVILAFNLSEQIKLISTELVFLLAVCWQHAIFILQFTHTHFLLFCFFQSFLSFFTVALSTAFSKHECKMSKSTAGNQNTADSLT